MPEHGKWTPGVFLFVRFSALLTVAKKKNSLIEKALVSLLENLNGGLDAQGKFTILN
jgi:hypothetical protein